MTNREQRYFDKGMEEGRKKFQWFNFLVGIAIGFMIGIFTMVVSLIP